MSGYICGFQNSGIIYRRSRQLVVIAKAATNLLKIRNCCYFN